MAKGKALDLTGKRSGIYTVIKRDGYTPRGDILWLCKCDCGTEFTRVAGEINREIKNGTQSSCGCLRGTWSVTHGGSRKSSNVRLYSIWKDMKFRCYDEKEKYYYLYGGRGISICNEWLGDDGYTNFYNWAMSNGYTDKLTIDRIDVNGNYCPENCRWATPKEQGNNKRSCHYLTLNGQTKTLTEWSEQTGIPPMTITSRLKGGWSVEDALTKPVQKSKNNVATFVKSNRDENGFNKNDIEVLNIYLSAYNSKNYKDRVLSTEKVLKRTNLTIGIVNTSKKLLKSKGIIKYVKHKSKDYDYGGFILTDDITIQDKYRHYLDEHNKQLAGSEEDEKGFETSD